MLNKTLIKNNFKKSIETYDKNAYVQKHTADKIINLIKDKKYYKILEIGSYTGVLTKKAVKINPEFEKYIALDVVEESKRYIKETDGRIEFINCDIENFRTDEKFDLIISNATLQWCNNFFEVFKRLKSYLEKEGIIAVSLFYSGNLFEIKRAFGIELNYPDDDFILKMQKEGILSEHSKIIKEEFLLNFENPKDILKHLKYTGVNSIKTNISFSKIKEGLNILNNDFNNRITYKPLYIIDKYL